jgi:hypothetical protein
VSDALIKELSKGGKLYIKNNIYYTLKIYFFFFKQTSVHKLKSEEQRELGGQEPNPATT